MSFGKKHLAIILPIVFIVLYFFSRFYNILSVPIFTDEAIYIRWSQIALNDASWRFISLTDGKQPMYVWIALIILKFIKDPLMAGRMVSVFSGFLTMIGMFFLTNELFKNKKIAVLASFFYIIYPFSLVYDRLALYDSLVAMFIIWSLYFEILLIKNIRLDLAMLLGMIIGGGMLTKSSLDFALILLPFSLLLYNFKGFISPSLPTGKAGLRGVGKIMNNEVVKWVIFAVVAAVIAEAMYTILRLSPFYYIINQKNNTFIYSPRELLHLPFSGYINNLKVMVGWFIGYTTVPFTVLIFSSFLVGKKFLKEKVLLLIWFMVPFMALVVFGKVIYPRFILFMALPLVVLGAFALYYLLKFTKKVWLKVILILVFICMFLINDFFILTDFSKASIPQSDREQLIAGWPSGIGIKESIAFLKQQSQNQKIYVATEGTFGLMPYSLEIFTQKNPNIKIKGFWPISNILPAEVTDASKKMPTYFVFYEPCPPCQATGVAPTQWNLREIMRFTREDQNSYYTLYQVMP